MARPRQIEDRDIHEAAREVFTRQGPSAPVSEVARRLGVSHAALFQRMGSKEQLMLDALCPGVPGMAGVMASGPSADVPLEAQLADLLGGLLAFLKRAVPGLVVLKAGGIPLESALKGAPPPPLALRRLLAGWLERAEARQALRVPDAEVAAEYLLGAIEARCFNQHLGGERFSPGTDEAFVASLARALFAPPAKGPRPRRRRTS
jgi:AcrR family transcriptional regulator